MEKSKPKILDVLHNRVRAAIAHLLRSRHSEMRQRMLEGKIRTRPHSPRELQREIEEFLKEDSFRYVKDRECDIILLNEDGTPKKEKCLGRPINE